jgi:hypothetical protein
MDLNPMDLCMQEGFASVRVVEEGPALRTGRHLPGCEACLVCEHRPKERKYHVTNHLAESPLADLAAIKVRCICEQGYQHMKEDLGSIIMSIGIGTCC